MLRKSSTSQILALIKTPSSKIEFSAFHKAYLPNVVPLWERKGWDRLVVVKR